MSQEEPSDIREQAHMWRYERERRGIDETFSSTELDESP
jgi:hypothetical protein